jgi:hypothetical protein
LTKKQIDALVGTWVGCKSAKTIEDERGNGVMHYMGCKIVIDKNYTFTWTWTKGYLLYTLKTQTTGKWKVETKFKKGGDCDFQLKLDTKEGDFGYFFICGPTLNNLFHTNHLSQDSTRHTTTFMKTK